MATGGAMWRRRVRRWLLRRVVVWSLRFMVAGCPTLGRRLLVVAKVDWFVPRSPEFLAGNMVDSDVSEPSLQNSVPLQADHDSLVPPPFQIWPCSFGA
uniref:Uncharacterized protein n=1 Tax=Oryza glaberrima TaxID=4538 RepID=I1QH46_ORYGL